MQSVTRADTSALPSHVRGSPTDAIPIVEGRLTDAYDEEIANIVLHQLRSWDNTGYSTENTGILWSVASDITGRPVSPNDDVQKGVNAWEDNNVVYQSVQFADKCKQTVERVGRVTDAVHDVIEMSQETIKRRLGNSVELYRGIYSCVWEDYISEVEHGIQVSPLAMEAWTLNKNFAEQHGDYTIRRTVSADDVLFFGELFQERQFYRMKEVTLGHDESYVVRDFDVLDGE